MSQQTQNLQNQKTLKFANGNESPMIGLGTYKAKDREPLMNAIKVAIQCGYLMFDCAWAYQNEKYIGQAIKEALDESNGQLKREDFFIISKLWNTFHSRELVRKGLQETLSDLQTDYLDLYLVHWPVGLKENTDPFPMDSDGFALLSDVHYLETWREMESLYKEGKVKNIGVSNFNIRQLQDVLNNCEVKPMVNQIEVNPYISNRELVEFCQMNGVAVEGYAPLGAAQQHKGFPIILEHPVLKEMAEKHGKTVAQICLQWGVQRDLSVLPKSVTRERIIKNLEIFDFTLTDEEMNAIYGLDRNLRSCPCMEFSKSPLFPFDELKQEIKSEF